MCVKAHKGNYMSDLAKHISSTLKNLRKDRGWSLDKAALETGVSKAMLGQIERQESSPTIGTLWKIATGFNTAFSVFIAESSDGNELLYSTDKNMQHIDKKIKVQSIFPFDDKINCEIFVIELMPGCEHFAEPHKPGTIEHVIVVDGQVDVFVSGDWKTLSKGQGLRFNANQRHGYRNNTSNIASFHDIIHYPQNISITTF